MLGCRGAAVLPEGMSAERFEWLGQWVEDPDDIVRTPGSESNVKEIYDKCAELAKDPRNVILNQFSEFGNYLAHYACTGPAAAAVLEDRSRRGDRLELAGFVAGTGSAGTLAAGDYLKREYGARIIAVEPTECPTLLYNGYGEHNIQGIGDKHVPLIHNVMNTDIVVGISDRSSDDLNVLFNTEVGRLYLRNRRGIDEKIVGRLSDLGLSSIANILAAIRVAQRLGLDEQCTLVTVATDGAELYESELAMTVEARFGGNFDEVHAGEAFGEHLASADADHIAELNHRDRERLFNLGYYTWVEQQGIDLAEFDRRKDQRFWRGLPDILPVWDRLIGEMNAATGAELAA